MRNVVEVIARGVCVKMGRLLLCQTQGAEITYLPGGHTEFEEPARVSLEREIQEELGLAASAGRFLGAVEHSFVQKGRPHCEWNVLFELDIPELVSGRSVKPAEDHLMFHWCDVQELKTARLEPAVLCDFLPEWLSTACAGERWASGGDFA
jgi:8-oxo-dGTP diphosphatase